jgi:hypothetical protein
MVRRHEPHLGGSLIPNTDPHSVEIERQRITS